MTAPGREFAEIVKGEDSHFVVGGVFVKVLRTQDDWDYFAGRVERINTAFGIASRARVREALEGAANVVGDFLMAYPEDIFGKPEPGQHGRSVDSCSAAALRAVLPRIAAEIRKLAQAEGE